MDLTTRYMGLELETRVHPPLAAECRILGNIRQLGGVRRRCNRAAFNVRRRGDAALPNADRRGKKDFTRSAELFPQSPMSLGRNNI